MFFQKPLLDGKLTFSTSEVEMIGPPFGEIR